MANSGKGKTPHDCAQSAPFNTPDEYGQFALVQIGVHVSPVTLETAGRTMLLIIWHSRTGAAQAMAESAYRGALIEGACCLKRADEVMAADMLEAKAYLFCCPENLAAMTGEMKEFFDRNYYPMLGRIEGRSYATMIAAGTDGTGAQRQIDRIATGWRLRRIAEPLIVQSGAQTPQDILAPKILPDETLQLCCDLGQSLNGGVGLGVF